jgi:hypothetical protein
MLRMPRNDTTYLNLEWKWVSVRGGLQRLWLCDVNACLTAKMRWTRIFLYSALDGDLYTLSIRHRVRKISHSSFAMASAIECSVPVHLTPMLVHGFLGTRYPYIYMVWFGTSVALLGCQAVGFVICVFAWSGSFHPGVSRSLCLAQVAAVTGSESETPVLSFTW